MPEIEGASVTCLSDLKELVKHLICLDAPDLLDDNKLIEDMAKRQMEERGSSAQGLVDLVRNWLREIPAPKGGRRYILRSDFNEAFDAYRMCPQDAQIADVFGKQLKVLVEKVLRDRRVYTTHWDELCSDLFIRAIVAAKRFKENYGTPYSFFYKVLYRRTITLHQRMMRNIGRESSYPYDWSSCSDGGVSPEDVLLFEETVEQRSEELRVSKLEMTKTLYRNLVEWSRKPDDERRDFIGNNLPAYFRLMREIRMNRAEAEKMRSLFSASDLECIDLGIRIEDFPIDSGTPEIKDIDRLGTKDMLTDIPEWADPVLKLLQEQGPQTEIQLVATANVGKDRLRAELQRVCKIRGLALHRDRSGKSYTYRLGMEIGQQ